MIAAMYASIVNAERIQERMNRRIFAIMKLTNGMSARQVLKHRRCKHFGDLVYFWVQNAMTNARVLNGD